MRAGLLAALGAAPVAYKLNRKCSKTVRGCTKMSVGRRFTTMFGIGTIVHKNAPYVRVCVYLIQRGRRCVRYAKILGEHTKAFPVNTPHIPRAALTFQFDTRNGGTVVEILLTCNHEITNKDTPVLQKFYSTDISDTNHLYNVRKKLTKTRD